MKRTVQGGAFDGLERETHAAAVGADGQRRSQIGDQIVPELVRSEPDMSRVRLREQGARERLGIDGTTFRHGLGDVRGEPLGGLGRLRFDGVGEEGGDFVGLGHEGDVLEPTLNLRPVLTPATPEAVSILIEGLVQNANDDNAPVRPVGALGQILEQMDVPAVGGRVFEALAELVEDD